MFTSVLDSKSDIIVAVYSLSQQEKDQIAGIASLLHSNNLANGPPLQHGIMTEAMPMLVYSQHKHISIWF